MMKIMMKIINVKLKKLEILIPYYYKSFIKIQINHLKHFTRRQMILIFLLNLQIILNVLKI